MALISRIVRLFKADFHSLLDQLEEPEAILNQAIREMQEEIASAETSRNTLKAKIALLEKQQEAWRTAIDELENRIDICFEQEREALAKPLIRKKLETIRCMNACERRKQLLMSQQCDIDEKLGDQKETLAAILNQKRVLTESNADRANQESASWEMRCGDFSVTEAELEAAFLEEKSRRKINVSGSKPS